jgi:putative transposase
VRCKAPVSIDVGFRLSSSRERPCRAGLRVEQPTDWGLNVITTPIQAPKANAYAERFVGTVRREGLDWLLITGHRHLERVLRVYLVHYNTHRPHRSLELTPPQARPTLRLAGPPSPSGVKRHHRLGGLIHEYSAAA